MTVQFNIKTGGRGIEWCDETRGPIGGCLHECKWVMKCPDCEGQGEMSHSGRQCEKCGGSGELESICYAKELAESGVAQKAYPHGFEHHYWRGDKGLRELVKGSEPLLIFVDSMADLFAANVPSEQVLAILDAMRKAPHHTYQSLTKAAPQLLKYIEHFPPNLWIGVSSPPDWFMGSRLSQAQQAKMLAKSMEVLAEVHERTGNAVWMSAEPVSWDIAEVLGDNHPLQWCVIGAASRGRQYFQPKESHVGNLLRIFDSTATPVFYKGNIKPLITTGVLGRWREDFPSPFTPAVVRRQKLCKMYGWRESAISAAHICAEADF